MIPLLLLALSSTPAQLGLMSTVPLLCADAAMTHCWESPEPDGAQGRRFFVSEVGEQSSALHMEFMDLRFHPWVANSALDPVVDEVSVFRLKGQATLTLLPGFAFTEDPHLYLGVLNLERPWTDRTAPHTALSYRELPVPDHVPSIAVQDEMAHSAGPWSQRVPSGQTLHGKPGGAVLATLHTEGEAQVLDREGAWTLILIEGPYSQLLVWTENLPEPQVPPAVGYCGGVHGFGFAPPPLRVTLPKDAPLYLTPGKNPIAHTATQTSQDVGLEESGVVWIELSLPWGKMTVYPDPAHLVSPEVKAYRSWVADGPLHAKAEDGSCTSATLSLSEGPFPVGELRMDQVSEIPGGVCSRSVELSWRGANLVSAVGAGGLCENPDGTGTGWGSGGGLVDTFLVEENGWVQLGGEWLNHDLATCQGTEPPPPQEEAL